MKHPALEAAIAAIPPQRDQVRYHTIRALIQGYHERWATNHPWTTQTVEEVFELPVFNPNTGRKSRRFNHAGKFDAIAVGPSGTVLVEHKTCSESIEPNSSYWKRLRIDTQISGYMLAAWQGRQQLDTCLYDVIRKPSIEPKKLTAGTVLSVGTNSEYLGHPISAESYQRICMDEEKRETPEMYGIRLMLDCRERPEWYFQRRLIHRSKEEIFTYATELWQQAQEIADATKRQHFRRNDKACFAYHRECEYLDLCAGSGNAEKFQHTEHHVELGIPAANLLTHSAISTYAQCPKKYDFRYHQGLVTPQPADPLDFGSAIHAALAAWWQHFSTPAESPCHTQQGQTHQAA
jgi:hypothetical protein